MTDRGKSFFVRLLAVVAIAGAGVAAVLGVVAHIDAEPGMSPLSLTISDYAISDRGGPPMEAAMLLLGLSSFALPVALWLRGCARRWLTVLLSVWSLGLIASAFVPTDPPGAPEMTLSGYTHRYVSVAAFVSLPIAGTLLLRVLREWGIGAARAVRGLAVASAVGLLALLYVAFPGERVMMGLVERALVLTELALLAAMALPLARRVSAAGRATEGLPRDTAPVRELTLVG